MFLLSPQTKVFLARNSTDMRKSFRGLIILAEAVLNQDPASGHLFVFVNKRRDMLKILHWDGSGWWIWYRQLERGTFQLPQLSATDDGGIELTPAQLSMMLERELYGTRRERFIADQKEEARETQESTVPIDPTLPHTRKAYLYAQYGDDSPPYVGYYFADHKTRERRAASPSRDPAGFQADSISDSRRYVARRPPAAGAGFPPGGPDPGSSGGVDR
jgi:transposase